MKRESNAKNPKTHQSRQGAQNLGRRRRRNRVYGDSLDGKLHNLRLRGKDKGR